MVSDNDVEFKTLKCRSANTDGVSLIMPVKIFGTVHANLVIDTGACTTIFSTALYNRIPEDIRPILHDVDPSIRLEVANDGLLTIDGQCEFSFSNKGRTYNYTVLIASIHEDGLIGLDFLHENDYELSAQKGLKLNGRKCRTIVEKVPLRAVRVTTSNKCIIPANSETVV